MYSAFIRKGHGYTEGLRPGTEPCTAFDGFRVIASPLGGFSNADRESRVWKAPGASYGVTYGSHSIQLAESAESYGRGLYILMHNGSGREVLSLATGPDWKGMRDALLAMDPRALYAFLYSIWDTANSARSQAREETAIRWRDAFLDGRIRKSRPKGGYFRVTIESEFERDLRTGKTRPSSVAIDVASGEIRPA